MSEIKTIDQLEEIYSKPNARAKNKVLAFLDSHAITLINSSHFAILSTSDSQGFTDLSPKGGAPGFIKVVDKSTLLIPDSSGNNRLDSLKNIIGNPRVGLLLMVNGVDEVVRVKGTASIHTDPDLLSACPDGNKPPKVVIKVAVESMYFHCAKAVMRGKLWSDDYKVDRSILPSLAEILKEQQNLKDAAINQEEMVRYYESTL
ncbi:Phosphohydrolase (MutT/nudix family protein) [Vibrio nigripulchritudo SO65]|uniref:pyridoxamine 5'-phosphate oxidase family protein n=1 Tax=Vibrio nigripulchritudo TaxID=28173 RepID=UPI0003B213D2|nr:pyridoxamine 5'-phosphate oxidase family protein [Vibrio nigripulchritudo]CCN34288.1 Phosphohydrolase (MutT/nudix family protein) [Vibrio nigripulchritudo AM115]CCN43894.1 Phosphohydrolase (MutT/nudix family protein) [Vibrio nigripulchritudo FTn2]CCN62750.1 Phosphohydrolase (MutT/nudix family protein) [Vibrio nigripulchritudo POn4]CCN79617.1 Phosphohydrolase (MutT/nudix family protein) [Vibrio nigripulchritudo SO65]